MEHKIYMDMARNLSKFSKCVSHKVCAIFVRDGRIVTTGINGTPSGCVNCNSVFDENNFIRSEHHEFSKPTEIHAEINAILFAAREGISLKGSTVYCTLRPCDDCLKALMGLGVTAIYYGKEYDLYPANKTQLDFLSTLKIPFELVL